MPAAGSGHGKKVGGTMARQRSRNTTPSSVAGPGSTSAGALAAASGGNGGNGSGGAGGGATLAATTAGTASLPDIQAQDLEHVELRFEVFRNLHYDDLVDAGTGTGANIPDYRSIDGIVARLKRLQGIADDRSSSYDRGMRLLSQSRRTRMDDLAAERSREEERLQRDGDGDEHQRRSNKRKRKAPDGGAPASQESAMEVDVKTKTEAKDEDSDSDSDSSDDGPPPRPVPQNQTFGEDPSIFPDPTVYEIRSIEPGMSEEKIREIYSVARYPKSNLADLIAGSPPDKDFSSAKPSNQINFSTFSSYIEPYFRAFTEEDLAFLRERGDHVTPFHIPKRGKRHYSEIWAEEDGAMALDSSPPPMLLSASSSQPDPFSNEKHLPPNGARGTIDAMTDEVAETDRLSVGPLLSRLLQALRPEHRTPSALAGGGSGDGDVPMTNGGDTSMLSANGIDGDMSLLNGTADGDRPLPVATFMPESAAETWKKATHPKLEYSQVDERIKQELRHIGFLPFPDGSGAAGGGGVNGGGAANGVGAAGGGGGAVNGLLGGGGSSGNAGTAHGGVGSSMGNGIGSSNGNSNGSNVNNVNNNGSNGSNGSAAAGGAVVDPSLTADYDGHYDDEVAARLRLLQAKLREQMLLNGARKARLAELVKERMAYQEYQTILEDLDGQVQAAYLKRTRTMGKSKKGKRPGGGGAAAGGAGGAGGAGALGTARPGIGDVTRLLMERRKRWMESIGTVFDDERLRRVPRSSDPNSSIFSATDMAPLIKKEQEAWDEEADEE